MVKLNKKRKRICAKSTNHTQESLRVISTYKIISDGELSRIGVLSPFGKTMS